METLSRLRRKPKPPAIETSVRRSSRDVSAAGSWPTSPAAAAPSSSPSSPPPPPQQHQHQQQQQQQPRARLHHQQRQRHHPPQQSLRKSPFRNVKLRASAKRPRGSSPTRQPSCSPVVAVFNQDSVAPQPASRGAIGHGHHHHHLTSRRPALSPVLPAFLALSSQEIDRKFHDITWAERLRVADAHRNQNIDEYRWGHYQQLDFHLRGAMDRYSNIRPWNYNRVRLRVLPGQFDYVNASAIVLSSPSDDSLPPLRYIAMQGPTQPSFDYVWRMVAEQMPSPAVIVQLTTMHENGFVKCHQYFPPGADQPTWCLNEDDLWADGWAANLTFLCQNEAANGAIEIRKLLLDVEGHGKSCVVWHLLYRRWPDFGVPTIHDMDGFFELMRLSREYSAPAGPRIVHCSAGVGRTGTFICLEHLMRELQTGAFQDYDTSAQTPDPIFDAVESLRQQRRGVVQGEVQYRFLYHLLRKLWCEKYGVPDDYGAATHGSGEPAFKRLEVADPFIDEIAGAVPSP